MVPWPLLCCYFEPSHQPARVLQHLQVDRYTAAREKLGLPVNARGSGAAADVLEYVAGCEGLTPLELAGFVRRCIAKYESKRVDPGKVYQWGGMHSWSSWGC